MTPRLLLRGTALAAATAAALSAAVSSSSSPPPPPPSAAAARAASPPHPHILFITADDLGYNDLGALNGGLTITPAIDALRAGGLVLSDYHTFKICSPSRASVLSGRFPFNVGFYDMSADDNHELINTTLLPELLRSLGGYATHALGKYDVGYMVKEATPTYKGFDDFYGYYQACNADYWFHSSPGPCPYNVSVMDWSDSVEHDIGPPDRAAINGTYNRNLLSARARSIVEAHDAATPLFMYLAFQNVHEGCMPTAPKLGLQAPLSKVELYNTTQLDTYKVMAAMLTELDDGVADVLAALSQRGMLDDTLVVFVSDNGGPLEHSTNAPLRGGKHTFYEGGVRVTAFLAGGALPAARRGATWPGLAHASDWYPTLVEGLAGLQIPARTGPMPVDGVNLLPAMFQGGDSPRTEVVHQVNNTFFDEGVQAIRIREMKLIRGPPGDNRTIAWPQPAAQPVPIGLSGAVVEPGTDHVRSTVLGGVVPGRCAPFCLFNLTSDLGETHNLAHEPAFAGLIAQMSARLDAFGAAAPPPGYIWPLPKDFKNATAQRCASSLLTGTVQPINL
jgi:arylsulfatase A-like enzyme